MSSTTLKLEVSPVPTSGILITLEDPDKTYGVREKVGGTLVVPAGNYFSEVAPGEYEYTFEDPQTGLVYQYFTRVAYLGEVHYFEKFSSKPSDSVPAEGRYSSQAGIEDMFGRTSVQEWSTVDNPEVGKVAVIQAAINDTDDFIDSFLNGCPFTVPFTDVIPTAIVTLANTLAGCYLYEAKGELDYNVETGQQTNRLAWHRKRSMKLLQAIKVGAMDLQLPGGVDVPRTIGYPIAHNF